MIHTFRHRVGGQADRTLILRGSVGQDSTGQLGRTELSWRGAGEVGPGWHPQRGVPGLATEGFICAPLSILDLGDRSRPGSGVTRFKAVTEDDGAKAELLYAVIARVSNIDELLSTRPNRVGKVELTLAGAKRAPCG